VSREECIEKIEKWTEMDLCAAMEETRIRILSFLSKSRDYYTPFEINEGASLASNNPYPELKDMVNLGLIEEEDGLYRGWIRTMEIRFTGSYIFVRINGMRVRKERV
jgi:hypothetical protein